ncbi:MAG: glycine cleavage system aminomethyltransferase GcvT [Spirochaetes bacterium]|nr:glycine cleavage system aminomethyltransferase GcvT [Spirochaetota bacterium]
MKRTPMYEEHLKLGGRMVDFAGWELPVMYSSIVEEHAAVRNAAGLFDVSHMGEILVNGAGAAAYLRKLIPTRMEKLARGSSMYSCFCNKAGGVIDDLFVYMLGDNNFYLVVNASTLDKDFTWMQKHRAPGVEIVNISDDMAKIDLQGPRSKEIAVRLFGGDRLASLKRFGFMQTEFSGAPCMVSQSGYTGEFGYEFYLPAKNGLRLWNALLDAGKDAGIRPCGLGSRDSLRLESCYSLYGHELTEDVTPVEGGIGWIVSSKDEYIGKPVLAAQKEKGAPRETVYFEALDRGVPREGCAVTKSGNEIGKATSAGYSPTLKKGIGIARVASGSARIGDEVVIVVRDKPLKARIVERPFYSYHSV